MVPVVHHHHYEHCHGPDGAVSLGQLHTHPQVMGSLHPRRVLGSYRDGSIQHFLGVLLGIDGHYAGPTSVVGGVEAPDEEEGEIRVCLCDEHGCLVSFMEAVL